MKITAINSSSNSESRSKDLICTCLNDYVAKQLTDIEDKNNVSLKDMPWASILSLIESEFKYPQMLELKRYIKRSIELSSRIDSFNDPKQHLVKEVSISEYGLMPKDKGIYIVFVVEYAMHTYSITVYVQKQHDSKVDEDVLECTIKPHRAAAISQYSVNQPKGTCSISSCKSCFNFNICKYVADETGPIDVAYARIKEDFDFLDAIIRCKYFRSE